MMPQTHNSLQSQPEGILLIDKPEGKTAFSLVSILRRVFGVRCIGHAGTLDPFATGLMVLLVGRNYTKLSDSFLGQDKEYITQIRLGSDTDTYDCTGEVVRTTDRPPPTDAEIRETLALFQGDIQQIPPMYSAKKVQGRKLYELARKGQTIERKPANVHVEIELLRYEYPFIDLQVRCSKGTYIRSLGYDIGQHLDTGAHLTKLRRIRSGAFHIADCVDGAQLQNPEIDLEALLKKM
jgi:tRNA pseudouridine55 synthase